MSHPTVVRQRLDPALWAALEKWAADLVSPETREQIVTAVREFLYRRSVFAYAFRLGRLDEEFAVRAACGMDVPETFDIRPRIAYQTNATLFYPNPALPPIDWEGIKKTSK